MTKTLLSALLVAFGLALMPQASEAQARPGPLRIEITEGVIEPLPIAIPPFIAESAAAQRYANNIATVVAQDLEGSGLFRAIPEQAFISRVTSFDSPVQFSDWKAINAQALVTGSVGVAADGRLVVKFRLFDVFSEAPLGSGLQFAASQDSWRRMAHKVADAVYSRITGESGYFDSRVVFVSEQGPKNDRRKRLAIMDYDGQNVQFLTDDSAIVLAPRFSPDGGKVLYTSYATGMPQITELDINAVRSRSLGSNANMSFSPRFSPDGSAVVYSLTNGANTDIYRLDLGSGRQAQLTNTPAIETAPSFSPDGRQVVFESDRSGNQQLYVMSANGGEARRISFGQGRYGTPVWSPRGDLIAFTKQNNGRFHIGVMRTDGSEERLLTSSFLDEGPTWAPNGRVIMFTRETSGASGAPALYSVDVSGRNLRRVPTPGAASDPSWSPLLE
ncbi:MAG: Tol-Pal system beta propeller repeat protein TolB [Pseudomonadota bacterium]